MSILRDFLKAMVRLFEKVLGIGKLSRETQKVLLYLFAIMLFTEVLLITQAILFKWAMKP